MKQGQFPEIIQLGDLNGQNGFKLDGENNGDQSGYSVSAAGDINDDGHNDLLIGARGYLSGSFIGRSYVVFGGPGVGQSGDLLLSSLNGTNGFKLDGENSNDQSGFSVSAVGDVNGDGHADLLIGAWEYLSGNNKGRSYVVFGGPMVGNAGLMALSSLNGVNGFKLDGENNHDNSGFSVSAAGDINGDGYDDLLISASSYPAMGNKGRSYVVFGGLNVGKSGDLLLSSLNGSNGFKLDGENNNDLSGYSVSAVGDINGDGYDDLVIGAWAYPSGGAKGRSYVVFGGPGVGKSGDLLLSSLNGSNGFKLDGENNGDLSGYPVSAASDINGDGVSDLLIGAYGYSNKKGRSYVVFGGAMVGGTGVIALSSLDGTNGFKLDGENDNDASGVSVSAAGDINGDGYVDLLIGASWYPANNAKGRSYVVFGGPTIAGTGLISLSSLNGANGFKLDGENNGEHSGVSVSASGDINGDGILDLLIGAYGYPAAGSNGKGRSYMVFGDVPPVLVNNSLTFYIGETVKLDSSSLAATDKNHNNSSLVFWPTNITHGQFEAIDNPGIPIDHFSQQQIWNGQIYFAHDGSAELPSYNITVRSAGIAYVGPCPANISLSTLLLTHNQIFINQGQTLILTGDNLQALYAGQVDSSLDFIISNLQHGRFELTISPGQVILNFKQQDVINQQVLFIHDCSTTTPSYQVTVSNGQITTSPQSAQIDFDAMPILLNNTLIINQGQTIPLTSTFLSATHPGGDDSILLFDVNNVQHGKFSPITAPDQEMSSFYQKNITDGLIQFRHDNSTQAPAYNVSVTDGRTHSQSQAAQIDFDVLPILVNNTLRINQGETILVTRDLLSATHSTGDESVLLFNVSDLVHGQFSWLKSPNNPLMNFYQRNITDGQIQFVHDGSTIAPGYIILVTDGRTYSVPQVAQIDFDALPVLLNNQLRINQGDTVLITEEMLSATHPTGMDDSVLLFNLTAVTHGQFYRQNFPTDALLSFYQQNVTDGLIEFKHDNSTQAPAYQVSVTDGRTVSSWQSALIDFDASPILLNNTLIINQGQTVRFTSVTLSATHPGGDDQILLFNVNNVQHGKFSRVTVPAQEIFNFYQQNITDGLIQFSHDNSTQPPSYTVSVSDGRITTPAVVATIDFGVTPILEANQLTINQGQVVILTEDNLRATQGGSIQGALTFIVNDLQHGQFTGVDNQQPLLNFQQQNITDRQVQFIHDNSIAAPSYRVSVSDGRVTSEPSLATISFDPAPILVNNQLTIGQDQTVTLTTVNLLATHNGTMESTLEFIISQVQNGGFIVPDSKKTSETGSNITFSQQQILDQIILFYQQGSATPAYRVSVSDGRITLPPVSANVTFYVKPVLTKNQFLMSTGQPALLTSDNLAATHGGQQEEGLQFLVSGTVSHGQFEKRSNPGTALLAFYQQDVMQQTIRFVPDNSTQTPDCRIKVFDSDTDLSSDAQESSIILVTQNNFLINQGETFTFSDTALKASSNQGHDEDIVFTAVSGTVQHGHFALAATPNYVISSFQQSQITQGEIVFVPDGSAQSPSCYLSIAASQSVGASGTVNCVIDFDTPPILQHAYLKTSVSEVIKMSDVNLKAVSSMVSPGILSFEISENQQGYFADNNDWQTPLTNFTQQRILDNQIVFITGDTGMAPKFKVSVWDGRMHCEGCPQTADVVFQSGGGTTNSNISELIKNAVIGAVSSGVVGLLFYALKYRYMLNLQRSARATLNGQAQSTYTDDLLLPIAREIFARIKITACFGYISKRQYNEYVGAVSVIVSALETKGVIQSAQWSSLSTAQTQRIIDAIAAQCKEIFGNKQCCSLRTFTGFYRPDATPKMIRDQANTIATAVQESLAEGHEVKHTDRRDVHLTQVSSSLNDTGLTVPLLQ